MRSPALARFGRGPIILSIAYLILALGLLVTWQARHVNDITGDELHYLITADAIIQDRTLEESRAYRREFETRAIYKPGLAPKGSPPSVVIEHLEAGPHGLFDNHEPGLPALVAPAFAIAGTLGVKVFLVLLSCLIVPIAWKISGVFMLDSHTRLGSVAAGILATPFLLMSSQIYPELPAGLICLASLYVTLTIRRERSAWLDVLHGAALAFLPWLQIKFAAAAVLLACGCSLAHAWQGKRTGAIVRLLSPVFMSLIGILLYNRFAFGAITGPYSAGALQISATSLMVVTGLFLDQNQGFLIQNPIMFAGVAAIGGMVIRRPFFAGLWCLVFASLIVPNGLHTNWYGGYSFSGRFGWDGAMVFLIPTLAGLARLAAAAPRIFVCAVGCSLFLQADLYRNYAFGKGWQLYNRMNPVPLHTYSIFYGDARHWLPALYDVSRAYAYAPNYVFVLLTLSLLLAGYLICNKGAPGLSNFLSVKRAPSSDRIPAA